MATCPRCRAKMDTNATVCPNCGYDFPLDDPNIEPLLAKPNLQSGFAFSAGGDFVLVLGNTFSIIGVLIFLVMAGILVLNAEWRAAIEMAGSAFICLLVHVIIQRVLRL